MSDNVEVLLSTYNGCRYLPELLESVRGQDYPHVSLSVRDDGSADNTVGLLEQLLARHRDSRLVAGTNLGAAKSFMTLLRTVNPVTRYAAFCDQDDVWLPDKLTVAVDKLDGLQFPALYCGAVRLVNEVLVDIKVHRRCVRGPSFENALVENIATGCTIVLNRPAIELLASRLPERLLMHDAWCYLVLAGCGHIVYDPEPHVLYRLHGSNSIGVGKTPWAEWSRRAWRQLVEGRQRVLSTQAAELKRLYGQALDPRAAQSLEDFLGALSPTRARLEYALHGAAHRQRTLDDIIFRSLYALHRI